MSAAASFFRYLGSGTLIAAVSVISSCEDDTFDRLRGSGSGVGFNVKVAGAWAEGSRAAETVDISEMRQDAGCDPLYLVTETFDADADTMSVSALVAAAGRGTPVTGTGNFHDSFGVSAMCYTSEPGDDFPLNFAYHLKATMSGNFWRLADGERLDWTRSGTLRFFAYSPHISAFDDGRLSHSSITDTGAPAITYTVPDDARSQTDLMTAVANCDGAQGGAVTLTFGHALTAVTVKTGEAMLGGKIKSVTLKNVYGKGSHRIGSSVWSPQSPRDFTVAFDGEGMNLPSTDKDNNNFYTGEGSSIVDGDITLMMIPQTLPADARLEIVFTDELTGTDRLLTASLAGTKWDMGKKVTYSLNTTGIVVNPVAELPGMPDNITLRAHGCLFDMKMKAYAQVTQKGADTKMAALPFNTQVSLDNGATWSDVVCDGFEPAEPGEPMTGTMMLPQQSVYATMQATMDRSSESGTPTLHSDLSGGGETANCYIIHTPGYYSLPLIYGNARTGGTKSYTYEGSVDDTGEASLSNEPLILRKFVGHDDLPVAGPDIPGAVDAVLVWQDAPDLVTDVRLESGFLKFRARKEAFTQGNAVVAVRNASKEIIWSWHIWATHYKWDGSADLNTKSRSTKATGYAFSPCNLGYCDPHGGNDKRSMKLRLVFTLPDGKTKQTVTLPNTITQDGITASIAGDNTYYQWGRKDPMLPGVYNKEILNWAKSTPLSQEYDMKNKEFFCDYPEYAVKPAQSGISIGTTIKNPHLFFMSHRPRKNTNDDKYYAEEENYLRRHWHNGKTSPYGLHAVMNFWDSQMDRHGVSNSMDVEHNERDVTKTIYDPCPPGYKMPPPNAFTMFSKGLGAKGMPSFVNSYGELDVYDAIENSGQRVGWNIALGDNHTGGKIFFPATGLRDMGVHPDQIVNGYNDGKTPETTITWPAHANLTFIATSGFYRSTGPVKIPGTEEPAPVTDSDGNPVKDANGNIIYRTVTESSTLLFYLDNRNTPGTVTVNGGTCNSYGFTVRPIHM